MKRRWALGLGGAAALVAGLVGCPDFAPDDVCGYPGFCGDSSIGEGGKTDGGDSGPSCDPKTENCIDPSLGVFVAPTGNDGNDGTEGKPLQTIGAGLAKAKAGGKSRVYVCSGTYAENVVIKDALSILGGFSCADWVYGTSNVVTVAPTAGLPLKITSTTASVSDVAFSAADATAAG